MQSNQATFQVLLRLHVHRNNFDSVKLLLNKIHEQFNNDLRFSIFLKEIGDWGGDTVKQLDLLEKSSGSMAALRKYIRDLGWYNNREAHTHTDGNSETHESSDMDVDSPKSVTSIIRKHKHDVNSNDMPVLACYTARPNSFVIRADGSISKCTVTLADSRNAVGKINDDGTLIIENKKMHQFMRGFRGLVQDDLSCPIKDMEKSTEVKLNFMPYIKHEAQ